MRVTVEKALAATLGLFLCLIFYRGGNTPGLIAAAGSWSLVCLLPALWLVWLRPLNWTINPATGTFAVALVLLCAYGALGLLPLSMESWVALPGRAAYGDVLAAVAPYLPSRSISMSIDAPGSIRALWVALSALVILLGVAALSRSFSRGLLFAIVAFAILEAVIGLMQVALARPSFLAFEGAVGGRYATGSFINRNHYATLLAMALPILIFRVAGRLYFRESVQRRSKTLAKLWWGLATALVATGLLASLSRAGTSVGFAVSALAALLCAGAERTWQRRILFLGVVIVAVALASVANLAELVGRFQGSDVAESWAGRKLMAQTAVLGAWTLFPLGAGLGSFAIAYPRFQPEQVPGFIEHAHNDYAQLLFETGFVGIIVLLLLAVAALFTVLTLYYHRRASRRDVEAPAVAALLGSLAFAIHSFFDFPAHIPATALVAVMLFGIATHREFAATPPWSDMWTALTARKPTAEPERKKTRRKSKTTTPEPENIQSPPTN